MSKDCESLIKAFFEALELRKPDQCQVLLQSIDALTHNDTLCKLWHTYLTGIFVNEFHRNWEEGERIFKKLLEQDLEKILRGRVLIALAIAYHRQGRWPEAIKIYQQCLDIFDTPDQLLNQAKVWKNMAIVLELGYAKGIFDPTVLRQALEFGQRVLDTMQTLENPDDGWRWLEATTLNTLALVHRDLKNWDKAKECCHQCLTLCERLNDTYGIGMALNNLGETLHAQGELFWTEAMSAYEKALASYRDYEDKYEEVDALDNLASLYEDMGDLERAASHYKQAIGLIEELRQVSTSVLGRTGYFSTVTYTYESAILLQLALGNHEKAFNLVEQARARTLVDMISEQQANLDLIEEGPTNILTLHDIQNELSADEIVLEYFTTGLVDVDDTAPGLDSQRYRLAPAKTLLFVVTQDKLEVHNLPLASNDFRPTQLNHVVEKHFLEPTVRQNLFRTLLEPVANLIEQKSCLYLIPHGPLHYVPFLSLIDLAGQSLLREVGPRIIFGLSAALIFGYEKTSTTNLSNTILAMGYNGKGKNRLKYAEEEAQRVAQQMDGDAWVGEATKKSQLFQHASNHRILHISCHGEFDAENPLASKLQLSPDQELTALEVLNSLNLNCDLVVLSACESGLSRVRRGDELIGFIRAFMYAGTRAIVSTLWRVDDQSTFLLMEKFYEEVQYGRPYSEALKQAQIFLRNLTRRDARILLNLEEKEPTPELLTGDDDEKVFADPWYWAAFIYIGQAE